MKKQLVKNVFSNYAATAVGVMMGVFLIPFMIGKLGKEAFGLIVLAESTIAFFEVLTVSARVSLSRYATYSLGKEGGRQEFVDYLSTGRTVLFLKAAVAGVAGCLVAFYFPVLFNVPEALVFESRVLFLLIAAAVVCTIPNIVFWAVLYAKQRFDLINFSLSFGLIARATSLFIVYSLLPKSSMSLIPYGAIFLAMTLIQNFMIYYWQKRVMPELKIAVRNFHFAKVKEIISFSVHTSLSRVSTLLTSSVIDVLINVFWGPAFNAIYSVGYKFPSVLVRLFMEGTWTLTPTFTDFAAKDDKVRLKRLFFVYTKMLTIVIVPVVLVLYLASRSIIHFWVGEGFETAAKVLSISVLPLLTALPFGVSSCIYVAYGKVKVPGRVAVLIALLNVGLAVLIGKVLGYGLVGVAAGSATASFLYYTLYVPYYSCKVAGISVKEYWTNAFLKPFAWSAFAMGTAFFAFRYTGHSIHSLPLLISAAVCLPLCCYAGAYFIVLTSEERALIRETVSETLAGFSAMFKKTSTKRVPLS